IYSGLCVIIYSVYIVYDTDNLIKLNSYDEYIWASISLYLDVVNVFPQLLGISRATLVEYLYSLHVFFYFLLCFCFYFSLYNIILLGLYLPPVIY
ncbi:bi1-like protein, partial [Phtheirospermum japonicum]